MVVVVEAVVDVVGLAVVVVVLVVVVGVVVLTVVVVVVAAVVLVSLGKYSLATDCILLYSGCAR